MATINDIQTQILTPIANAIRAKEGTTAKIPNNQLASRIENLQTGTKVEGTIDITENGTYDVSQYASANVNVASSGGEDTLQTLIDNKKTTTYLFSWFAGDNIDFIKKLDFSNVTGINSTFYSCSNLKTIKLILNTSNATSARSVFYNCKALIELPQIDLSKANDISELCFGCSSLTEIPVLNTSNATSMSQTFSGCSSLKSINGIDMIKCTSVSYMLNNCTNLENLTLFNIKTNLQIGKGSSWGHLLTLDSLISVVKELIKQSSTLTLTMGTANLEKIANTYVKFVDSTQTTIANKTKGDVVVCESTDSGAMLLSDYASLKNWTLA